MMSLLATTSAQLRQFWASLGTLRRGELVVDTLVDSHLLLEVDCPGRGAACGAQIELGDSGGGCFVEDASRGWLQIGVTKSVEAAVGGRAWERVQTFVPLQQIDSWIDHVTGLHLHQ